MNCSVNIHYLHRRNQGLDHFLIRRANAEAKGRTRGNVTASGAKPYCFIQRNPSNTLSPSLGSIDSIMQDGLKFHKPLNFVGTPFRNDYINKSIESDNPTFYDTSTQDLPSTSKNSVQKKFFNMKENSLNLNMPSIVDTTV